MSTERDDGILQFSCDRCGFTEEAEDGESFGEAWGVLREGGWRCFKNSSGDWEHRCPDCVGKHD